MREESRATGVRLKLSLSSLKGGVLEKVWGDRVKPRSDGTGEVAAGCRAFRKGARSVGRGGGVGGTGVAEGEQAGEDTEGSSVRKSHSLVTACRSGRLSRGRGEGRSQVVEDGGGW